MYLLTGLVTLPSAASTTEAVAPYSLEMFSTLWPVAITVCGIFVGIFILILIKNAISGAFDRIDERNEFDYEKDMGNWYEEMYGSEKGQKAWKHWQTLRHRPREEDYF